MYVILKRKERRVSPLTFNTDIFPRPTPWRIAFRAFFSFLGGDCQYQMALVTPGTDLNEYEIDWEFDTLVLRCGDQDVQEFPIVEITWGAWWEFAFQSFVHGLFLAVWRWRWA